MSLNFLAEREREREREEEEKKGGGGGEQRQRKKQRKNKQTTTTTRDNVWIVSILPGYTCFDPNTRTVKRTLLLMGQWKTRP